MRARAKLRGRHHLGAGPNRISQGIESSTTRACTPPCRLRDHYETIMVQLQPRTVSTATISRTASTSNL